MQRVRILVLALAVVADALLTASMTNAVCCGDCDADGLVTVDNLIVAVNNALGTADAQSCTISREPEDVGAARAVGISPGRLRLSGAASGGESFVLDLERHGDAFRIVDGSITESASPMISDLQSSPTNDVAFCGSAFPQRLQLRFSFRDANGDLLGGNARLRYSWTTRDGTGPIFGDAVLPFFPQPQRNAQLPSPTAMDGVATLETCWLNVRGGDVYVTATDGAGNASAEIRTSVAFP